MNNLLRYENVSWSMPFLFVNDIFVPILINILQDRHCIKYVYGSVNCRWQGGRAVTFDISNMSTVRMLLSKLVQNNIKPVFTFSSITITKDDLDDVFCNDLLKLIAEFDCQIIIASDILYNYIRNKYPQIKLVASIIQSTYQNIKDIDEDEHINNLLKKYERVVVRPEWAVKKDGNFSNINDLSRLELLINQNCNINCMHSNKHYELLEQLNRREIDVETLDTEVSKICPNSSRKNSLTDKQVEKFIQGGITNLKLQGRNYNFNGMLQVLYTYYFGEGIDTDLLVRNMNDYISVKIQRSQKLQLLFSMTV